MVRIIKSAQFKCFCISIYKNNPKLKAYIDVDLVFAIIDNRMLGSSSIVNWRPFHKLLKKVLLFFMSQLRRGDALHFLTVEDPQKYPYSNAIINMCCSSSYHPHMYIVLLLVSPMHLMLLLV